MTIEIKRPLAFPNRARIRVSIFADEILLTQRIFDPTEAFKQMDTAFSLATRQRVFAKIETLADAPGPPAETTIAQLSIAASGR